MTEPIEIYALAGEGLPAAEIARATGCSVQVVHMHIDTVRKRLGASWPPERVAKLLRIHKAAMRVIAEAFGVSPDDLAAVMTPDTKVPEQAVAAPRKKSAARSPRGPRTRPRMCRMRNLDGEYLHCNGSSLTTDPEEAWTGTAEDTRSLRAKLPAARHFKPEWEEQP